MTLYNINYITKNKKPTLIWAQKLTEYDLWEDFHFKWYKPNQVRFDFVEGKIDLVESWEEFCLTDGRIALLVGSQFGIIPKPDQTLLLNQKRIAILRKSLLSGHVDSLTIYDNPRHGKDTIFIDKNINFKINNIEEICIETGIPSL